MLSLTVSELNLPDLPEARIVVYTPRDEDTRAKMPLTRRNRPGARIGGRTKDTTPAGHSML